MRFGRTKYEAGESALGLWREQRRRTIRREWRIYVALALAAVGLVVGIPFVHGAAQLLMAAAVGSLLTTLYVGWELGGDVRSLTWRWGQFGEQATEDALRTLDNRWRVIHDLPRKYGNWDHVVVGPAGVFLLETKNYKAAAIVRGDRLSFGRTASFKGRDFAREAKALYWSLDPQVRVFVIPVVVIWGEFAQSELEETGVVYIAGKSLTAWLNKFQRSPQQLSAAQIDDLATAIEQLRATK